MTNPIGDDGASVGRLLSDMGHDFTTLFRQELELAKCELAEKAQEAKKGATTFGIGAGMGLAATMVLAAAVVLGLTLLLSNWIAVLPAAFISALVVGIGLGAGAYAMIRTGGKAMSPEHFVPERTLESLKENTRWARNQI